MNKFISFTKWAFTAITVVGLVFIYSCSDDPEEEPEQPIEKVDFAYAATDVEVGETATIAPATTSMDAATWSITDDGGADFVTINANTGELSVGAESTTGTYTVSVQSSNEGGTSNGSAEITIILNADFDLAGKNLLWKYWINNTPDVAMINLNMLPGQEALPDTIPLTTGWPEGWPMINLADPTLPFYFIFPTVQYFLMQVPGDDACAALDPAEEGDTLLLMVNADLTLSTHCKNPDKTPGTVVDLGTSSISYSGGAFVWTLNLTLQGVPVTIAVGDAVIEDFTDPMDPHWEAPSGNPRTFSAVTGNVAQYMTPTNFDPEKYLESIQLLDVDVVFEILADE
jgi:hypothetical protein